MRVRDIDFVISVSIHAPTRGATPFSINIELFNPFQSTHPHGVRRKLFVLKFFYNGVSIHAPTRGATLANIPNNNYLEVSIHAPTRGATARNTFDAELIYAFQSTHPHGVRPLGLLEIAERDRFQSTHPHGVRLVLLGIKLITLLFQSTHPHGVRLDKLVADGDLTKVSIHAPTRGATRNKRKASTNRVVSIHAPTRGATRISNMFGLDDAGFNPRTHTGCDLRLK